MRSDDDLERIAGAVADGTPVDWERERSRSPEHADRLDGLSSLERVRDVHREPRDGTDTVDASEAPAPRAEAASAPALFHWGSLRVLEKVGEGGYGEVYRAYDPSLDIEVALKLNKPGTAWLGYDRTRALHEARRLARVRHPNVLAVRGADEHGDRLGIWTDFIRGRSLEEQIRQEGPLSAREAAMVGLDLCGALAAVHARGLVHRDVKTSNVMREQGGRILLMDFGSVAEIAPDTADDTGEVHGTPLAMAPEQLRGRAADARSDIYALGVLLYRLVTCRYPIEARGVSELLDLHAREARIALRDRRPDLPLPFVQVVERALAPDPKQRYASAGAMERALSGSVEGLTHSPSGGVSSSRRGWTALGLTVLAAGLALWAWTALRQSPDPGPAEGIARSRGAAGPSSAAPRILEASAALFRRTGSEDRPLSGSGGTVGPGDRLSLDLQPREPMYAYVLNEDDAGAVYVLFPIPGASPTNPLSSSIRYRLPGRMGDSLIYWTVTSVGGREEIVVIGSRAPLRELEEVIDRIPRVSERREVRFERVDPAALGRFRSIGGLAKEQANPGDARRLEDAIQALDERRKSAGDVWIWRAELANPAP